MTETEILAKAYFVLGLEAGAPLETINTRWKRLAMVWHSDRFPTVEGKKDADEELKKINDSRDKLKAHFVSNHKPNAPCACNGNSSQSTRSGTGQGPGPGKRRTTQESDQEEAEAKRRNAERAHKAAKDAAEQARRNAEANRAATAEQSVQDAIQQSEKMQEERLRWKIAVCIGVAWLGLSLFGFIGMGARQLWHGISFKLQQIFPAHTDSAANGSDIKKTEPLTPSPPVVPPPAPNISPYDPLPVPAGNSNKLWQEPPAKVQPELAPVQRFSGPDTQTGTERTP
jgi:hypothetical protein